MLPPLRRHTFGEGQKGSVEQVWTSGEQSTIPSILDRRLANDPDGEYLDVCGTNFTAASVMESTRRLGGVLVELGTVKHDRVATLIDNSAPALLAWFGAVGNGRISVPINTAYKGDYLRHQLTDSGARVLFVAQSLLQRLADIVADIPHLEHVVVVDDDASDAPALSLGGLQMHAWEELLAADLKPPNDPVRPSDLATFIYTGGTTGLSKGCMLSHNYHEALARQIGICWGRTAEDVVWTPLPLYHFNALATVVIGTLVYGGRGAIYRRFSVSQFWPEMNRVGATITSTLGTMAYLLAHDVDRPEMPRSVARGQYHAADAGGCADATEVDDVIRTRFGVTTFSGAYGVTEASLISWQPPGTKNRPNAAGVAKRRVLRRPDLRRRRPRAAVGKRRRDRAAAQTAHVMFEATGATPRPP